jgi:hypothetical protein
MADSIADPNHKRGTARPARMVGWQSTRGSRLVAAIIVASATRLQKPFRLTHRDFYGIFPIRGQVPIEVGPKVALG